MWQDLAPAVLLAGRREVFEEVSAAGHRLIRIVMSRQEAPLLQNNRVAFPAAQRWQPGYSNVEKYTTPAP